MSLNYINILLLIMSMCFSTSCNETHYTINNLYIENPTDKEYLVCLDYKNYHEDETNLFCVVLPNTSKQILDTQFTVNRIDNIYRGVASFNVWVYNKKDSSYVKIDSKELLEGSCPYGRIEDDNSEQKNNIVTSNFYFTINDSLLVKMTKNLQLTDSIFGTRKLK